MAIGNPAFCHCIYLTDVHFWGELQHGGDVSQQKIKCRPIRTREIGVASLSDVLYVFGTCFWIVLIRVQIPLMKFCLSRSKTLRTLQPLKGFDYTFPQCVQNCSKSHINEIKRSVNSSSANSRPSNLAIVKTWRIQKNFLKNLEILLKSWRLA